MSGNLDTPTLAGRWEKFIFNLSVRNPQLGKALSTFWEHITSHIGSARPPTTDIYAGALQMVWMRWPHRLEVDLTEKGRFGWIYVDVGSDIGIEGDNENADQPSAKFLSRLSEMFSAL